MKEIKTKPAGGQPRTFDKAGVVPKTAMKEMWLHTKDKALSETMGTPFHGHALCQPAGSHWQRPGEYSWRSDAVRRRDYCQEGGGNRI